MFIMPYTKGIVAAIRELKDRNGSSVDSIKKHMKSNVPNDDEWNDAMFSKALKAGVESGKLVKTQDSYKLSSAANKIAATEKKPIGLEGFRGTVTTRSFPLTADYKKKRSQYGTVGNDFVEATPEAIVEVLKDGEHSDIMCAIDYAKANNISLAIRSGGHQYLAFSSTTGNNLQLDMKNYKDLEWNRKESKVSLGPAWTLRELQKICKDEEIYFPHGECVGVGVGGHCQTGGYSLYSHSFGLFIDYITSFHIITADKQVLEVIRPNKDAKDEDNDDLWFSVLGGSPGNFGIVIKVEVQYLHDKDYLESRVHARLLPFNKEVLEDALKIMEETADDKQLSHNIEYSVMVLSAGSQHRYKFKDQDEKISNDKKTNSLQERVEGLFTNNQLFKKFGFDDAQTKFKDLIIRLIKDYGEIGVPILAVFACYTDVDKSDAGKISGADWWNKNMVKLERLEEEAYRQEKNLFTKIYYKFLNKVMGKDGEIHTPLSQMDDTTSWKFDREYNLPFQKRVYNGADQNLQKRGFAKWAAEKCWELEVKNRGKENSGLKLAGQFITGGSNGSRLGPSEHPTAVGNRMPGSSICTMDFFYQTCEGEDNGGKPWGKPLKEGSEWLDTNPDSVCKTAIGKEGKFADVERRFMYAPWGPESDPQSTNVELDSDEMIAKHYTSKEDYLRVRKTKLRFDPQNVFTPNSFCVGYDTLDRNDADFMSAMDEGDESPPSKIESYLHGDDLLHEKPIEFNLLEDMLKDAFD